MRDLINELKILFQDDEARYAYAEAATNARVAAQIKALRKQRGLTQEDLARIVGTKQPGISRLQNANNSSWKVDTLRKLARAFGVRLRITFEEFGTLVNDLGTLPDALALHKFEDDPTFFPKPDDESTAHSESFIAFVQRLADSVSLGRTVALQGTLPDIDFSVPNPVIPAPTSLLPPVPSGAIDDKSSISAMLPNVTPIDSKGGRQSCQKNQRSKASRSQPRNSQNRLPESA